MTSPGPRPKILMLAYACNPEGSGEHWLGWGWAEQAAKDYSVHLLTTPNAQAQIEKHAPRLGITPHFVAPPGGSRWGRKLKWQKESLRQAQELHAQEKFALVHQTTFHSFRVPFRAAELGIPSVWGPIAGGESVPPGFYSDLGSARFGEAGRRLINRLWLRLPAVQRSLDRANVIFVSNRTTLEFLPAPIHRKCVIVAPNALRPEDERQPEPAVRPAHKEFELLYVGNCVATRALPLVFAAIRNCGLRNVKLTVVGTGPALENWKACARAWNLDSIVEFTGQVARDRLPEFYARADALVFPALRDSGGSALLEAMARGLPVICLDWAGPGEMLDASSGVKIPVRDRAETIAGLAAAVARLQALPSLCQELGRAGRARALACFRWEAKGRQLRAVYQKLLSSS